MYTALSWLEPPSLTAEITLGREKIVLATVVSRGKHTAWLNWVVKVLCTDMHLLSRIQKLKTTRAAPVLAGE